MWLTFWQGLTFCVIKADGVRKYGCQVIPIFPIIFIFELKLDCKGPASVYAINHYLVIFRRAHAHFEERNKITQNLYFAKCCSRGTNERERYQTSTIRASNHAKVEPQGTKRYSKEHLLGIASTRLESWPLDNNLAHIQLERITIIIILHSHKDTSRNNKTLVQNYFF